MIAKREEEIRNFKPQSYYGMRAVSKGITFQWQNERSGSGRTFDKIRVEQMKKKLEGESLVITRVERTSKKTYAPGLYDLTELQRDANKRFGFSAKETLNLMQRLYENHKVLTYPRTDSRYLSSDVVGTLKERLKACSVGPYRKVAGPLINREIRADKRFVNDAKVSDHHAIIPTEQFVQLEHMTSDERKIYDLVVRRFAAVLLPAAEYEQTVLKAEGAGETFVAKGKVMKKSGWLAAYEEEWEQEEEIDDLRDQILPNVELGAQISVLRYEMTEGKTKPPAPFNEATLLSAMENPVKYMTTKDAAAAKALGETGGLGTVATRADIIEKLFNSFLMEKRGKDIFITSKAKQLLELVPEGLKQPELTADWEMKLSKIAKGQMKASTFMREIDAYTQEIVEEIKLGKGTFRHDNVTNKKCPQCGKPMLAVNGKNSRMLVCQDRECGYRETVARTTNARCPKCHKRMELYGKGDSQTFICACGYKEKLSAFEVRRAKEGKGVSKRDVQKYLNQQKKEAAEPINTAFAAALANLNLPEK